METKTLKRIIAVAVIILQAKFTIAQFQPFNTNTAGRTNGNMESIVIGNVINGFLPPSALYVNSNFLPTSQNYFPLGEVFRTTSNAIVGGQNAWRMWTGAGLGTEKFAILNDPAFPNDITLRTTLAGNMIFSTNSTERMRILGSNGNIGIGTIAPVNRQEISSGIAPTIFNPITAASPTRSGLRFTDLNATMTPDATNNSSNTILSVNNDGDVILVNDGGAVVSPPATPILVSPCGLPPANYCTTGVTLTWLPIAEPLVFYEYQVASDAAFLNIITYGTVMNNTTITIPVGSFGLHYWRVRANTIGGTSAWSSPCTFDNNTVCAVPATSTPSTPSDSAFKMNVTSLTGSLDKVKQLKGVSFYWKTDQYPQLNFDTAKHIGFIAQEVAPIVPEVVFKEDGFYALDYPRMTALLTEAIKDLAVRDSVKDAQIAALQAAVNNCCNTNLKTISLPSTDEELVSASAILYQNIPNPFGDGTVIRYYVSDKSISASMIFHDEFGNEIKNMELPHRGQNAELNLTTSNLASGIYSYSLIVDGKITGTKNMIKTK